MSEIRATTISDAAGTGPITLTGQSAAKAWVNFNGTGTVAIRNSLNLSSITDYGAGTYGPNYANNFSAADYAAVVAMEGAGGYAMRWFTSSQLTVSDVVIRVQGTTSPPVGEDNATCQVSFHGDLA